MKRFFKIMFVFILIISLGALSMLTYFYILTKDTTLDTKKLTLSESSVTFYDNSNTIISDISLDTEKSNAKLNELPDYIKNAFISTEDRHFYTHNGIDYKRIIKASVKNLASFSYKEGASTISQQLIKNTYLTNEKTIKRKLLEMKLTEKLEQKYTKDEILELYLNSIYFGENSFGIQKASKLYFNKKAKELTISESAMLAAIIKAPSTYSPYLNPDKCLSRRNFVLQNMHNLNYINDVEYNTAINTTIPIDNYNLNSSIYLRQAYKELQDITKLSPYVLADGCKIYTYLDNSLQEYLENLQIDEIENFNKSSVIINNNTNGISAYISTTGNINRMPGSVIKPLLVYAPALENNIISPASLIVDEPTTFGGYSPKNYNDNYYGYINIKKALSKSLNVPAVKILNYTGIENSKRYLDKMNLFLTNQDDSLTIALGGLSYGLPLIELTNGYSVFANKGIYKAPSFIAKIEDKNGNVIYQNNNIQTQVYSEGTSFLINDILKETVIDGTAKNLKGFKFDLAAKTGTVGTATGNSDAYCICYTSEYTIGSWLGNKDELMPNKITGGTYPAIINKKMLEKIYLSKTPSNFFESEEVTKVKLDKISYEKDNIVQEADDFTPMNYFFEEYFKNNNLPTSKSDRFTNPIIDDADISIENNIVKIELCVAEYYEYTVFCEFNGKNTIIYDSIDNERKDIILDTAKEKGIYKYTIVPYFCFDEEEKIIGLEYSLPEIKTNMDTIISPPDESDEKIKDKNDWWID